VIVLVAVLVRARRISIADEDEDDHEDEDGAPRRTGRTARAISNWRFELGSGNVGRASN
jgi:hypothetical protein